MGERELFELAHRLLGEFEGVGLIKHGVAEQRVEVGQVLRRLGLVQQHLRLFRPQPQPAPELVRESGVGVRSEHIPATGDLAEAPILDTVLRVGLEGQQVDLFGREHEHRLQVRTAHGASAQVEQPQERGEGAPTVVEGEGHTTPGWALAQEGRPDLTRLGVGLALVGTQHVGDQTTLAVTGLGPLGGRVELQPRGTDEDGCHRVEDRRLSRARRAGEQQPLARDIERPRAVKGAPVDQLDAA